MPAPILTPEEQAAVADLQTVVAKATKRAESTVQMNRTSVETALAAIARLTAPAVPAADASAKGETAPNPSKANTGPQTPAQNGPQAVAKAADPAPKAGPVKK